MPAVNVTFNVPAPLLTRITTAMRGTYPAETAGQADTDAFKTVVRLLITQVLAGYEGGQAGGDAMAAAGQARAAAASAAANDASAIT